MSEWWTYRLSDFLMFAPRTYYRLFALYNDQVWPAHAVALACGAGIAWLLWRPSRDRERIASALLACAWLWVAWEYFQVRYASIHWAGGHFAAAWIAQALLIAAVGTGFARLHFRSRNDVLGRLGIALFLYALVLHPGVGIVLGRPLVQAEVLGIAPDPTAIATLGVLTASRRIHPVLLLVPLAWCLYSAATLWTMHDPIFVVPAFSAALALIAALGKVFHRAAAHVPTPPA